MQVSKSTSSYNDRRYGKPWIARVDFSDPTGTFTFGNWVGAPGEAGELQIAAEAGDIVADGQKDFRNAAKSAPSYYVVDEDGSLNQCDSKIDAYKHWQDRQAAAKAPAAEVAPAIDLSSVPTEALIAEINRRNVSHPAGVD